MLIVLGKKIGPPERTGRHFLKKRRCRLPLIPIREINSIPKYEKADHERRGGDQQQAGCPPDKSKLHRSGIVEVSLVLESRA